MIGVHPAESLILFSRKVFQIAIRKFWSAKKVVWMLKTTSSAVQVSRHCERYWTATRR